MAGSRALVEHVSQLAMVKRGSVLNRQVQGGALLELDQILAAFHEGDSGLRPVIERSGRYLGRAMAHLFGALNIRHIFIAGKMALFGDALLNPIRGEVERCTLPALAAQLEIHISNLGANTLPWVRVHLCFITNWAWYNPPFHPIHQWSMRCEKRVLPYQKPPSSKGKRGTTA